MALDQVQVPPAGLRSGMAREEAGWWRSPGAGIPSRRRRRRSRPGAGVQVVRRVGCSTWTPAPGPLRGKLADATGCPLPAARPGEDPRSDDQRVWTGPSVGRPSGLNDGQQHETTLTNGEGFRWSASFYEVPGSALLGLPEDLVNLNDRTLAGRADLRDSHKNCCSCVHMCRGVAVATGGRGIREPTESSWSHFWSHPSTFSRVQPRSIQCSNAGHGR